jgi:hypothetical protein
MTHQTVDYAGPCLVGVERAASRGLNPRSGRSLSLARWMHRLVLVATSIDRQRTIVQQVVDGLVAVVAVRTILLLLMVLMDQLLVVDAVERLVRRRAHFSRSLLVAFV